MLNIKHPRVAFAIDCKKASEAEYFALSALISAIAESTPGFVVEGLGNVRRPDKQETKIENVASFFGFMAVKASVKKVQPDVLYVGVDEKYDISYGYRKDTAITDLPQLGVYVHSLPVYVLGRDTEKILEALAEYVAYAADKTFASKEVAKPNKVEFTASYVRVNGEIMTHSMYKRLFGESAYQKPAKKCDCSRCQLKAAIESRNELLAVLNRII